MNVTVSRLDNKSRRSFAGALLLMITALGIFLVAALPTRSMSLLAQDGGDAGHGKSLYDQHCLKCHALDEDKEGPRLRGIYGSKAATISRFNYSTALKESKVIWDSTALSKWLADPDGFIPDSDMRLHIDSPSDRADVVAYLKTISK